LFAAQASLSVQDLADLISASAERYKSMDLCYSFSEYDVGKEPKQGDVPSRGGQVMARFASGRLLTRTEVWEVNSDNAKGKQIRWETVVSTPTWQKKVSRRAGDLLAEISLPKPGDPRRDVMILDYMLNFFGVPWGQVPKDPTAQCSYDDHTGLWRIERSARTDKTSVQSVAFVDADKGYMPVRYELYKNGALVRYMEAKDFRLVNGLWMPYEVKFAAPESPGQKAPIFTSRRVESLRVNEPIAAEDLDYVLPAGTRVDDRIAGLRYTVGRIPNEDLAARLEEKAGTSPSLTPLKDALRKPASDAELEGVFQQAQLTGDLEKTRKEANSATRTSGTPDRVKGWPFQAVLGLLIMAGVACAIVLVVRRKRRR
jgi:hypothetical protein